MADGKQDPATSCGMVVAVIVGIIISLIAYTKKDDGNKRSYTDQDVMIVARDRLREQLRDPDSLQIISEKVIRPGRNGGVVGYEATYRAKNGFGGYAVETFYTE